MYKSKSIFLIATLFLMAFVSCTEENEKRTNATPKAASEKESILSPKLAKLYQAVVDKHDEVMPLDNDIAVYREQLKKKMEILQDGKEKDQVMKTLIALGKAHDEMIAWMRNFKNVHTAEEFYQSQSEEIITKYLRNEETSIENVANRMHTSVEMAKEILR